MDSGGGAGGREALPMTELKVLAVDAITQVAISPDEDVAQIHFRQGEVVAALQFPLGDAEKVTRSLSATIWKLARDRGIMVARDCTGFEVHANLEGASVLLADTLTTETLHLSRDQMRALRDRLDTVLSAEAAQPRH